ncbi:amino acid ABC transporter ATP-binding/permease protein [Pseudoponticoccus marisrubri]|uniref:Glutathione/cysteine ABC transporter permease/ATPase n=1 Tax=Pseudoponticoccus marisrubri TaxID=1685382 RepID=A0A0W7WFQ2_9RHOB|nr:ATP-binding cassette domain-containing protein [Pseudoponticoccus marisrubri]KUF09401.1 glutathione/cysteine ABC transporter permease/ATPase [Pseudoponticoccus marisrubri]
MTALLRLVLILARAEQRALWRGLALSVTVLAMGVALLGLSGWFITAAAAAGMAGLGILFNVFAPSAMVRLLALGRTAARYGERVLTHDATLRALSGLRIRLLQGLLHSPYRQLERMRANAFLNRVTADTDALDGALLRLILPALAGWTVILCSGALLWPLVHPWIALAVAGGYLILPTATFALGQRVARHPARRAEAALQAARSRLIDLVAGRDDLAMHGQLRQSAAQVETAFARHAAARARLDGIERVTGALLDMTGAGLTVLALGLGIALVQQGAITAPQAAIGVFVALALGETVAPVRRALSEIGRMTQAARRILPALDTPAEASGGQPPEGTLVFDAVTFARPEADRPVFAPLSLRVAPGETVVLEGPSGSGKSTALLLAAGALTPSTGTVRIGGQDPAALPLTARTGSIAVVPQRHALIAGTVAENLRLAAPEASEDRLWQVLETVQLADTLRARDGLETRLGFRGTGLSGGEARRLVLARALLRQPRLLLLDEPTEGLDAETARAVMSGLRAACPGAAILLAAHRTEERACADRHVRVTRPENLHDRWGI